MKTDAFERARSAYGTGAYDDATLEFVFPQLKESEDERIRKAIVELLKEIEEDETYTGRQHIPDMLAYLEKQKVKSEKPIISAEWSEEDQLNLNWVIAILNGEPCDLDIQLESLISWLKSLRPVSKESLQSHWKPSEEQN